MLSRAILAIVLLMPAASFAADVQQVDPGQVLEVARASLKDKLANTAGRTSLVALGAPEVMRVPAGKMELKVRPVQGAWPRSRVGVPVDISVNGQVVRSATVWFALQIERQAMTYGEAYPLGASASRLQMESGDIDVATISEAPIDSRDAIAGMRLRRAVRAGDPVLMKDFEAVPVVDRSDRVQVLASYGVIHLTTHGTANEPGGIGDIVAVLVDGAEAPSRARVTEKGVVQIVQ